MKFSPCSWLRLFRDLTPHERITVWAREQLKTQRQVTELTQRVGELETAVAGLLQKPSSPPRDTLTEQVTRDFGEGYLLLQVGCGGVSDLRIGDVVRHVSDGSIGRVTYIGDDHCVARASVLEGGGMFLRACHVDHVWRRTPSFAEALQAAVDADPEGYAKLAELDRQDVATGAAAERATRAAADADLKRKLEAHMAAGQRLQSAEQEPLTRGAKSVLPERDDHSGIKVAPVYECPECHGPVFLYPSGNIVPHYGAYGPPCAANRTRHPEAP